MANLKPSSPPMVFVPVDLGESVVCEHSDQNRHEQKHRRAGVDILVELLQTCQCGHRGRLTRASQDT